MRAARMRLVVHYRELQSGAEPIGVAAAKRFDNDEAGRPVCEELDKFCMLDRFLGFFMIKRVSQSTLCRRSGVTFDALGAVDTDARLRGR